MSLSWNKKKEDVTAFSQKREDVANEDAKPRPSWIDFFNVFVMSNCRVTSFEYCGEKATIVIAILRCFEKVIFQRKNETESMFTDNSLADLYAPITRLIPLVNVHNELDRAFNALCCYTPVTLNNFRRDLLFGIYTRYNSTYFTQQLKVKKKKSPTE